MRFFSLTKFLSLDLFLSLSLSFYKKNLFFALSLALSPGTVKVSTISWLRQAGAGRDGGGMTLLPSAAATVKLAKTDGDDEAPLLLLFREQVPSLALLGSVIFEGRGQRGRCARVEDGVLLGGEKQGGLRKDAAFESIAPESRGSF